jgi:hypothetical protein
LVTDPEVQVQIANKIGLQKIICYRWDVFTEPLTSNGKELRIETGTDRWEGFNNEMGPGAQINKPSLIQIGSDIEMLIWGKLKHTDTATFSHKLMFTF